MSIHNNKPTKNSGTSSSTGGREWSTWKHMCDKCNVKFPTRQIINGHKRKHWWERTLQDGTTRRSECEATIANITSS